MLDKLLAHDSDDVLSERFSLFLISQNRLVMRFPHAAVTEHIGQRLKTTIMLFMFNDTGIFFSGLLIFFYPK